jgi:pimeloyl-ACP methyl ester carboxylesterase
VLHGLGDSLAGWAQAALPLCARHRVHLIDLPGHGLSDRPPDWRLQTLLEGVGTYASRLRRPLLVGHSLGGWLALRLVQRRLCDAAGLLLVNPAGPLPPERDWEPFRRLVLAEDARGARDYLRRAFHAPPLLLQLYPRPVLEAMRAPATRGLLDALLPADFLSAADLAELPALPLRLIWGESDRLLPPGTRDFFRAHLPAHQFVPLPGAGHLPHLEAPLRLARALLRPLR